MKHLDFTSYFYIAYYWKVLGVYWLAVRKGTEAVSCFHPQDSSANGNGRKKGWVRKFKYQTSLGGGESWTWEECDLSVFLSLLPVSPGSVSQRFSGKSVVTVIWIGSSSYGDKCPHVPQLSPCMVEEGSHFEVSDASWKIQSRQHLRRQNQLQRVARSQAQNAVEPVLKLIKI